MDITLGKTIENPYLQRKEVHGKLSFTGATPSQKQLADALATKLGVKADVIFVAHLFTTFGAQSGTFEAHVYSSKEQLGKVVKLGKKAKENLAKAAPASAPATAPAAPAEAKPAEAAKAEAPKKEEKKAEA
jgi:ribosomal protein S24E